MRKALLVFAFLLAGCATSHPEYSISPRYVPAKVCKEKTLNVYHECIDVYISASFIIEEGPRSTYEEEK